MPYGDLVSSVAMMTGTAASAFTAGLAVFIGIVLGSQSVHLDQNVAAAEVQSALVVDLKDLDADRRPRAAEKLL